MTTIGDLPEPLGVGHRRGDRFVAGLLAANHFDQLHLADRIEEVNAAKSLGMFQVLGQLGDRNRRRVRRQDRVGLQLRLQATVDLPLDVHRFDDRFDHQIGRGNLGVGNRRVQQRRVVDRLSARPPGASCD